MTTETAETAWIELPGKRYVSADSMQYEGEFLSLSAAANMDVDTFNKQAAKYGVHMDESDAPIDRLVKYSIFLSRRDKDCSQIPTNSEYVDMLLDVAARKADEPFASLYSDLKANHLDVTRDVLEFHGKVAAGPNKGKYEVRLLRFDEDGALQPVDEILVPPEGRIVAIGAKHKFPLETGVGRIGNIEVPGLEDSDASGYWAIGNEPVKGEQRMNIRDPLWVDDGLLRSNVREGRSYSGGDVGALRSRSGLPSDYQAEINRLKTQASELRSGIDEAQAVLARLVLSTFSNVTPCTGQQGSL